MNTHPFHGGHSEYPAFTQTITCPICKGTGIQKCEMCRGIGWKREVNGYRLIPCPQCRCAKTQICLACRGKRKLPEYDTDGRWKKKVVTALTKSNQEMME